MLEQDDFQQGREILGRDYGNNAHQYGEQQVRQSNGYLLCHALYQAATMPQCYLLEEAKGGQELGPDKPQTDNCGKHDRCIDQLTAFLVQREQVDLRFFD